MSDTPIPPLAATSPLVRTVRMFVAPVDRAESSPKRFDAARQGRFDVAAPPDGWFSLGAVHDVERIDTGEFAEVWSGAPATLKTRARSRCGAGLRCTFSAWSKLALALSSGSPPLNLLRPAAGAASSYSGCTPDAARVLAESTATELRLRPDFIVGPGDTLVVDTDYAGDTGYLGFPFATACVTDAAPLSDDTHYLRRISFNLGQVASVAADAAAQTVTLVAPLPGGIPAGGTQASAVQGFQDRMGATFLGEWSALLVADGIAGDRVLWHYPRLQTASGTTESLASLAPGVDRLRLTAHFTALPVTDAADGENVVCFRSYLPAANRTF